MHGGKKEKGEKRTQQPTQLKPGLAPPKMLRSESLTETVTMTLNHIYGPCNEDFAGIFQGAGGFGDFPYE